MIYNTLQLQPEAKPTIIWIITVNVIWNAARVHLIEVTGVYYLLSTRAHRAPTLWMVGYTHYSLFPHRARVGNIIWLFLRLICQFDYFRFISIKQFSQSTLSLPIFVSPTLTPIARAVLDLGAVREGPYVNGKPRATGRATKFQTK